MFPFYDEDSSEHRVTLLNYDDIITVEVSEQYLFQDTWAVNFRSDDHSSVVFCRAYDQTLAVAYYSNYPSFFFETIQDDGSVEEQFTSYWNLVEGSIDTGEINIQGCLEDFEEDFYFFFLYNGEETPEFKNSVIYYYQTNRYFNNHMDPETY